jgi:hypothetical protein
LRRSAPCAVGVRSLSAGVRRHRNGSAIVMRDALRFLLIAAALFAPTFILAVVISYTDPLTRHALTSESAFVVVYAATLCIGLVAAYCVGNLLEGESLGAVVKRVRSGVGSFARVVASAAVVLSILSLVVVFFVRIPIWASVIIVLLMAILARGR